MKTLYVFYDGECGLCTRCRHWLAGQATWLRISFHPFQSEEAKRLFPDLTRFQPEEQLIVLSDEGGVYRGEFAWLICLHALRAYRPWARKLAAPTLRPLAQRLCYAISHNRYVLARVLMLEIDKAHASKGTRP